MRSATPELDRLIARALAGHLVEGPPAPPNYSLRLGPADRRPHHRLFQGCDTVVRTRSPRRLLRALGGFLADHASEQDTSVVSADALVLVRDGIAALLPPELRPLLTAEDELRSRGFAILDRSTAAFDPATGELVVAPPALTLDEAVFAAVADLEPTEPSPTVAPSRYPVRYWAVAGGEVPVPAPNRGMLVARTNRRVRNREAVGAQVALSTLARVAQGARPLALAPVRTTQGALDQLVRLTDDDRPLPSA